MEVRFDARIPFPQLEFVYLITRSTGNMHSQNLLTHSNSDYSNVSEVSQVKRESEDVDINKRKTRKAKTDSHAD